MSVFLTEAVANPANRRAPKPNHPWAQTYKTMDMPRQLKPAYAHHNGPDGDDVAISMIGQPGCYREGALL